MMTSPTAAIRLRRTAVLLTMLVAVVGLVLGCGGGAGSPAGGGGGPAAPPGAADSIVIKNFSFGPASLIVTPGTKITVTNDDQAPHTVTATDKSFDSGNIAGGQSGVVTAPTKPGTYSYICTIHQYMMGTLIVK